MKQKIKDFLIGVGVAVLFAVFLVGVATKFKFTAQAAKNNSYVKHIDLKESNDAMIVKLDSLINVRIKDTNTLNQ